MARIDSDESEPHLLLVEGRNDKHVVWQICNRHPELPDFFISDRGDINAVMESIGPEILAADRQALGILVDTDDDPRSRWDEIAYQLRAFGVQPPSGPDPDGTIIPGVVPRVGVWLMPGNNLAGEIEEFVASMVPSGDPVWPLAQAYIDGLPSYDGKFPEGKTLRAKIYAWLATRADPRLMGQAIGRGDLETNGPLCQRFLAWLNRLFN